MRVRGGRGTCVAMVIDHVTVFGCSGDDLSVSESEDEGGGGSKQRLLLKVKKEKLYKDQNPLEKVLKVRKEREGGRGEREEGEGERERCNLASVKII